MATIAATPPRRLGNGKGDGSSRGMEPEVRENAQDDEDPRERWFHQENSRVEICTLFRLEEDLNSTLLFKHGVGQRPSELWLTRILLGCFSWERTTLGKAVEVFAKL